MIEDVHRTEVKASMPPGKAAEKIARTRQGLAYSLLGALITFGGLFLALRVVDLGGEISMWPVVLIGGIVAGGLLVVFFGGRLVSGELSSAFWADLTTTVTVWRRGGS